MAADDLAVRAADLAGAVGMNGQFPAEPVQYDMVMPGAVTLEIGEAGGATVSSMPHVVGLAGCPGLIAAAKSLAARWPRDPHT